MAKKAAKETSTPLVFALVFFVLTTIAFGVMWYMQYADQEAKVAQVAEANKKVTAANAVTKEAELNAMLYRIYLGVDEGEDRTKLLAEHKAGDKVSTELKRINDALAKKLGLADATSLPAEFQIWTPDDKGKIVEPPTKVIIEVVGKAVTDRDAALASQKDTSALYAGAAAEMKKFMVALDDARKKFDEVAKALPADFDTKLKAEIAKFEARKTQFVKAEADSREALNTKEEAIGKLEREQKRKDETIGQLNEQLSIRIAELAKRQINTFQYDEPHGKIIRRPEPGIVEVNIGASSNVRPGLTFTVLPYDFPEKGRQSRLRIVRAPDERGVYKNVERFVEKATIEVIEVLGPALSRCRVTQEADPIRDGAAPGDLIYNGVWRKGASDHIALVGIFDINGDGTDDIENVVRDMNNMGVTVDAYFNLKERKWVGQITEQTRYLVEGWYPVNAANDPNRDDKTKLVAAITDAVKLGRDKGVAVVKFQDFFPRMGYRVKLDVTPDRLNQATAPYLNRVNAVEAPMNPN